LTDPQLAVVQKVRNEWMRHLSKILGIVELEPFTGPDISRIYRV
jgi:hypothetical protein